MMATRSALAIYNSKDDSYDVVYCHWDGYPSHQLPILTTKYNTVAAVRRLLAPGDLSALETDKDWHGNQQKSAPLYYVQRGEENCGPQNMSQNELDQYARNCDCEYLYTFIPRKGWQHKRILL